MFTDILIIRRSTLKTVLIMREGFAGKAYCNVLLIINLRESVKIMFMDFVQRDQLVTRFMLNQ